MSRAFVDRTAAGRALAAILAEYGEDEGALILALPRGGVPVAAEVARLLRLPLDVLVTAKMRMPGQEELAVGAVGSGEVTVRNERLRRTLQLPDAALEALAEGARAEARRREEAYRESRDPLPVRDRTVLLVDDGLATGASMRAAVRTVRGLEARRIVVGVPVGAADSCAELRREADEVRCLFLPPLLRSVGEHYEDFSQVTDDEVRRLLAELRARAPAPFGVPPVRE